MIGIHEVIRKILERRTTISDTRSLLVGVSGIDGCGKGHFAKQLEARLALHGVTPALLNVDGWLNLPEKRFDQSAPAENFYANAIRFDQFFSSQRECPFSLKLSATYFFRDHFEIHVRTMAFVVRQ